MSELMRRAAIQGLRRAVKRKRLVVSADPAELTRAHASGKLVIDTHDVAYAVCDRLLAAAVAPATAVPVCPVPVRNLSVWQAPSTRARTETIRGA